VYIINVTGPIPAAISLDLAIHKSSTVHLHLCLGVSEGRRRKQKKKLMGGGCVRV